MQIAPFSKPLSFKLMRRFEDLTNKKFIHEGKTYRVRIVTVMPFDLHEKKMVSQLFFKAFNHLIDFEEPMKYILKHSNNEYDVCIVATTVENGGISIYTQPIATLVSENGNMDYGFKIDIVQ